MTRSAVSQGMRRLEDAPGQQLVAPTTRSVRLTEAGERLVSACGNLSARSTMRLSDDVPRCRLRLAVTSIAEPFLSDPLLARFAEACPEVIVDVTVTDKEIDIVARGYHAGILLGEVIERDTPLGR